MILSKIRFVSKEVQDAIPYPHKLINNHYAIIMKKDKALILTTSPLRDTKSHYVSHLTVEGDIKNQYLSSIPYKVDPKIMEIEVVEHGERFLKQNVSAIFKASRDINWEDYVELAQYVPWLGNGSF